MITVWELGSFIDALRSLNIAQTRARLAQGNQLLDDFAKRVIRENLKPITREAARLGMPGAVARIAKTAAMLDAPNPYSVIAHEIDEIFDAVEKDAFGTFFCQYQRGKVHLLLQMSQQWDAALKAFKSAEQEIGAAIECYALGHNTACVFHMARVGEIGLRAIGRERGVKTLKTKKAHIPIEWATWGQVFSALRPKIEDIRGKPNGPQRDAALSFYEPVLSDLRAIQSLYRDQTMHLRDTYDDGEAQSAMFRVRELMTTLSTKLDENSIRAIPWSSWK